MSKICIKTKLIPLAKIKMKTNHINYDFEKSLWRLDEILNASNDEFKEVDYIPNIDAFTFKNWYYIKCTVLFVDIRDSSSLPKTHKRPAISRIYKSFISEVVAILNWNDNCKEINIEWDCVWWVFKTPNKVDIDWVFSDSARISSLIKILNCKLIKKNFETIKIWIWMDYWRALMIKGWYSWSWINDIVWVWDVVNNTSKLCWYWNKEDYDRELMISKTIYSNLNEHNKELMKVNTYRWCYHSNLIIKEMDNWKNENCN